MRKTLLVLAVALLAISIAAPPASALTFVTSAEEYLAKFKDVSNLFVDHDADPSTPMIPAPWGLAGGVLPLGSEQRTLLQATTVFDSDGDIVYTTSYPYEISGLLYDLELLNVFPAGTGFILDFGDPVARNPLPGDVDGDIATFPGIFGGVLEMYEDWTKDYTQDPGGVGRWDSLLPAPPPVPPVAGNGPSFWVEGQFGAIRDQFPGGTDGSYALSAVLLELQALVGLGVVLDPILSGAPAFTQGTLLREFIDFSSGTGSGFAYANIFGGAEAWEIGRGILGPWVDIAILFDLNTALYDPILNLMKDTVVYQGLGFWQIDSEDPAVFVGGIPEPTTLSLIGLSLVGLLGVWKKRKS